ncbi:MAG: DPP IV N-terminal domain-containing protein [Vicinamibacterales bacterium]
MRVGVAAAVGLMVAASTAWAQATRPLTLDDLYDPATRIDFSGGAPAGLAWISDTHYLWPKPDGGGVAWTTVEAATGQEAPLFATKAVSDRAAEALGVDSAAIGAALNQRGVAMDAERTAAVVSLDHDLYYIPFGAPERAQRLTATPEPEDEVTFSPDGRLVSFLRGHDLYVVDVDRQRERRLTTDGGPQRLNGRLDWIYQEEIYGRGTYRGYWWSPTSTHLAFLQLDETAVPGFTVVDHTPRRLGVEHGDYPGPGDPNPTVRLGLVSAAGSPVAWVDLDRYTPQQILLVKVSWMPDGSRVVYQVQDREQTWLDLDTAALDGGAVAHLLRETTPAWVSENGAPLWLADHSFLWVSERTGWRHIYHYAADGTLIGPVTAGAWDARTFHGTDRTNTWIYFSGTERSYIGSDIYRIRIDGSGLTRLSEPPGTHTAAFSPGLERYLDTWSDLQTPPQVRVHRSDGTAVRTVHESRIAALGELRLVTPQLLQVTTRDGFTMEALLYKPAGASATRRVPVMQFTYGGPYAPSVVNRWGGATNLYYQLLADRGIAVWICDNRSASGKGIQSAWTSYKQLGVQELVDIEDGLAYLRSQPWVDGRFGLDGWSYGGFMTTYALTHSKSFVMGIGGGSVTDWRLYDSVYTERMMRMPQHNPEGYQRSSVVAAARDLSGELLLIHGVIDDNVHLQHTLQLTYELQKAGKPFRLMLYERSRHAVVEPELVKHMRQLMLDFTLETLGRPRPASATSEAPAARRRPDGVR